MQHVSARQSLASLVPKARLGFSASSSYNSIMLFTHWRFNINNLTTLYVSQRDQTNHKSFLHILLLTPMEAADRFPNAFPSAAFSLLGSHASINLRITAIITLLHLYVNKRLHVSAPSLPFSLHTWGLRLFHYEFIWFFFLKRKENNNSVLFSHQSLRVISCSW